MEPLDTILYEEGTQVPLNPHTTSSQVSHKDTTVEKALEETVNFVPQELTPEQQAQARENINALEDEAGVIDEEHIAIGAVTTDKLADDAVTEGKLASQSVSSKKIKDDAVTGDKIADDAVISTKLATGARKPIILTPDTTEVDEETYRKLLSDDVDVVFKTDSGHKTCILTLKFVSRNRLYFYFTSFVTEEDAENSQIYGVELYIEATAPHRVLVNTLYDDLFSEFLGQSGYINRSALNPILQEIDLTGTGEDRKAKLNQFAEDWIAMTDYDLRGSRFVGYCETPSEGVGIFSYNAPNGAYTSIVTDSALRSYQVTVEFDGSLTITPLFSHLEAITISIDNTPESKAANIAAIEAYEDNLEALGFDSTKGYMIPITASGRNGFLSTRRGDYPYAGYAAADSSVGDFYNIRVLGNGEYYDSKIQSEGSGELHTISKKIVPAINEVRALAKGYSALLAPIELTTDPAQNKIAIDARVAAFTAQGISLTNGYYIPVTYKGVYAGTLYKINDDWYGLLVKNTNNPADNINIKLSADGTVTTSNSAQ